MDKLIRCKKCGRLLKSPLSIARGMGSTCAGVTSPSGRSAHVGSRQSSGLAHTDLSPRQVQTSLIPGELRKKRTSKRELFRQRREERRRLFETRETFQCGVLLPKRKPLVYTPLENGSWQENPGGRVISHERLQAYLMRYRFI